MPRSAPKAVHVVRQRYETWNDPLPQVPGLRIVGRDSLRKVVGLKEHTHRGFEICYVERGSVTWWVGREIHELRGGQMLVTWPEEAHGGMDEVLHPCKTYWLELDFPPSPPRGWLGLAPADARRIHQGLKSLPRRRYAAPASVARLWDRIFEAINARNSLSAASVRGTLLLLLIEVIENSRRAARERPISPPVEAAVRLMDRHFETPLSLPAIAERIGWSTSHFKRQFRIETGLSPAEFYLRRRLSAARHTIQTSSLSLADVALRHGFSSSQYLSTCFQRVMGKTPSSCRKSRQPARTS